MSRYGLALLVGVLGVGACDEGGSEPRDALYTIEVSGEQFRVLVHDQQAIARMDERMRTGARGVVMGQLASGSAGYNSPWSWHLVPHTVDAPDLSIELCDGRPSMVEADLSHWLALVGSFCPWGARVVSRVDH